MTSIPIIDIKDPVNFAWHNRSNVTVGKHANCRAIVIVSAPSILAREIAVLGNVVKNCPKVSFHTSVLPKLPENTDS